ncbi:MAG: protein-glutamate O-methyltransferase CheR [Caulobacteraceae bacterium]|nr:protein-glutamate O-methyltransferase CheR [Caulobacteraceae bacterium]
MEHLAAVLKAVSGFVLTPDKHYLIEPRLAPVARRYGMASVEQVLGKLRTQPDEELIWSVAEAMSVNETTFFRDKAPFDLLRDEVAPALAGRRAGGRLKVWCAGVSTGQEAYSIAMLGAAAGLDLEILGTDFSQRCLEKAVAGVYTQFEVQRGLPIRQLVEHFDKQDEMWRANARLRQSVHWRKQNLMGDFRGLGPFDIVFCRNVLPYFDADTRRTVLEKIAAVTAPDGFLFLGVTETAMDSDAFRPAPGRRGLYARDPEFRLAA